MSAEAAGTLAQIIPVFLLVISLTSKGLGKYELIAAAAVTFYLCAIEALLIFAVIAETSLDRSIAAYIFIPTTLSMVLITTPRVLSLLRQAYEREHSDRLTELRAEVTRAKMVDTEREYEERLQAKVQD